MLSDRRRIFSVWKEAAVPVKELRDQIGVDNDYEAYQFLEQPRSLKFLSKDKQEQVAVIRNSASVFSRKISGSRNDSTV